MFALAAVAVARDWITGAVALPAKGAVRSDPAYKGTIIVRYWYLIVIVLVALVVAFAPAQKAVDPAIGAV